jgi:hypothetical protein
MTPILSLAPPFQTKNVIRVASCMLRLAYCLVLYEAWSAQSA